MNHRQLIERSHKQAVDKGFWVKPLTFDMAMALIISEIAEALEAYRKGRVNPDWNDQDAIKNAFETEIADAIIRIYDWCGGNNLELDLDFTKIPWKVDEGYNFMTLFQECIHTWNEYKSNKEIAMEILLEILLDYCLYHKIDIEKYVMWKLDYNLNREFLHGKKF